MSVIYCHDCDQHYDEDFDLECPGCGLSAEEREDADTEINSQFGVGA